MKIGRTILSLCLFSLGILLVGCDAMTTDSTDFIEASGVVEAVDIVVASEMNGRIIEIRKDQGDAVQPGEVLFILENDLFDSQRDQAIASMEAAEVSLASMEANVASAEAGVEASRLGLEIASLRFKAVLRAVRLGELAGRATSWNGSPPDEFDLPSWYFTDDDNRRIAEAEVANALEDLEIERNNLDDVLNDVTNADIRSVEERLARAQFSFELAQELIDREVEQNGEEAISDYLQSLFDSADAELQSAQAEYDSILTEEGASEVLEARARVVVAEERYQLAVAKLYQLSTGENSIDVLIADLAVRQAATMVAQAEASLSQAQAGIQQAEKLLTQAQVNLALIELQIEKLTIVSKVAGVIMVKTIEVGELLQPGVTAMTIGQLDDLKITVYVPEEIYGRINIGDQAEVVVDSFEGTKFSAVVTRIADQAEYTPRNVQTAEDRRTTVFAIELSVEDPDGRLKPGMPADVRFSK